jgi:CheY-like chemotaxis protein
MNTIEGKIVLVDDQPIEKELLKIAIMELGIEVDLIYFNNGEEALTYLKETADKVFLIISDMNMPKMSGLDFKKAIDTDNGLQEKAIPFIFSSTEATKHQLKEAYDYRLQGYFLKPNDLKLMAKQLETIINYWSVAVRPDSNLVFRPKNPFID